jgi:MFS family permease
MEMNSPPDSLDGLAAKVAGEGDTMDKDDGEDSDSVASENAAIFTLQTMAALAGNVLEFYDFSLFSGFADVIGENFFPSHGKTAALIQSLSVFGASFVMRPLGGVLLGRVGDTLGRKRALELGIWCMSIPSFLLGCLPTPGPCAAPAALALAQTALVLLRLLQGLASGGELAGVSVHLCEAAGWCKPCGRVGSSTGFAHLGSALGVGAVAVVRVFTLPRQLYIPIKRTHDYVYNHTSSLAFTLVTHLSPHYWPHPPFISGALGLHESPAVRLGLASAFSVQSTARNRGLLRPPEFERERRVCAPKQKPTTNP